MLTTTVTVTRDAATAWRAFTDPEHVMEWNFPAPEWHCPAASNELERGGKFCYTMAARDGSASFDFSGVYEVVDAPFELRTLLDDGRHVIVEFEPEPGGGTRIVQRFEPENIHPEDFQQAGWQAILDNYAKHVESLQ